MRGQQRVLQERSLSRWLARLTFLVLAATVCACVLDSRDGQQPKDRMPSSGEMKLDSLQQASTAPAPQRVFATGHSIYVVTRDAELLWYGDTPQNGTAGWAPGSGNVIGLGWTATTARLVFGGGDGIVYVVDSGGNLKWFKDLNQNGTPNWAPGSDSVIAQSWENVTKAFADQNGTIYAVTNTGDLKWYKDLARNGTVSWAPGSGNVIGTGWQSMLWLMADASGVIYGIDNAGALRWYRDTAQNGTFSWAPNSGAQIGIGWQNVLHAFCAGGGVIYAVEPVGSLRFYRDTNQNGGQAWAPGSGNVIASGWDSISYTPSLATFGHGTLTVNGRQALGSRPMLAILAQYSDFAAFTRPQSYYDSMYFAEAPTPPFSTPNNPASLSAYIKQNSNARFTLTKAGMIGPLSMGSYAIASGGSPDAGPGDETGGRNRIRSALTAVSNAGLVNFASLDTNGDGTVSEDELLVIVVENRPAGLVPVNRASATPLMLNGKQISVRAAMVGEQTSFDAVAHELTHSLGTSDLHNGTCLSMNPTVMSCTDSSNSLQNPRHLDAWHKFKLGWIDPIVRRITTSGSTSVSTSTSTMTNGARLFWKRERGTSEYFLVERRTQTQSYDIGVSGTGLVIWHVNASNGSVVALGSSTLVFGGSGVWQGSGSTPTLNWRDGTSTGSSFTFSTNGFNNSVSW
jgi:M6 family metalloprotease-like protein